MPEKDNIASENTRKVFVIPLWRLLWLIFICFMIVKTFVEIYVTKTTLRGCTLLNISDASTVSRLSEVKGASEYWITHIYLESEENEQIKEEVEQCLADTDNMIVRSSYTNAGWYCFEMILSHHFDDYDNCKAAVNGFIKKYDDYLDEHELSELKGKKMYVYGAYKE